MTVRAGASKARPETAVDLYLELLARNVTGLGRPPGSWPVHPSSRPKRLLVRMFARRGIQLVQPDEARPEALEDGRVRPANGETMIGMRRLENIRECMEDVLSRNVPGDFIETGVWRGGATIFMRGVLAAHGIDDRTVWAADSFEGVPPPDSDRYPKDAGHRWHLNPNLAVSEDEVRENFARYGLLDDQVRLVKGLFKDSLPALRDRRWALIRIDGDLYESTIDALSNLYPQLSVGGYALFDDYGDIEASRAAVDDYRREHGITEPIHKVDWSGVYWQRRD